jgi:hypothetical protein
VEGAPTAADFDRIAEEAREETRREGRRSRRTAAVLISR